MPTLAETDRRGESFTLIVRAQFDEERVEIIDALAAALANGSPPNRSAALRYLVDVHAGREVERLRLEMEAPAAPYEVASFAKPKLSRELASYVAGSIAAGLPRDTALDLAGVTKRQRTQWWRRGELDSQAGKESLYADLVVACRRAEAQQKQENIAAIRAHRAKVWTAAAWLLERQHPDEYGERKRVDGKMQHTLEPLIDWDRLTASETKQLVFLLKKGSPASDAPGVGRFARPAAELLPQDVVDDAEWEELEREAPPLDDEPEASLLEAGAADDVDAGQLEHTFVSADPEKPDD